MKYIVVLGDGMADEPIGELGGKTPLEFARTPNMDRIVGKSEIGLVRTIPDGMEPGSDTANLAVLGYDPEKYYTGRSPLEALSIGVPMEDEDVAMRCNLVTLSDGEAAYEEKTIIDHSSGEISTDDAGELIKAIGDELGTGAFRFYAGTSYRHLVVWKGGKVLPLVPPHDVLGRQVGEYLPKDARLKEMMKRSYDVLNAHPLNIKRERQGLNKANSIWFWGAGTRPALDSFESKFGKRGAMISAVDLLKGIAVGTGMKNVDVKGANGTLDTNWEGKADAALAALFDDGCDFAYVHMEAPDEMGHQGSVQKKIKAIERLDERTLGRILDGMDASGKDYWLLLMPDHPTPVSLRTHTSNPVPYMLYDSRADRGCPWMYNEKDAAKSGVMIERGYSLMGRLLELREDGDVSS